MFAKATNQTPALPQFRAVVQDERDMHGIALPEDRDLTLLTVARLFRCLYLKRHEVGKSYLWENLYPQDEEGKRNPAAAERPRGRCSFANARSPRVQSVRQIRAEGVLRFHGVHGGLRGRAYVAWYDGRTALGCFRRPPSPQRGRGGALCALPEEGRVVALAAHQSLARVDGAPRNTHVRWLR